MRNLRLRQVRNHSQEADKPGFKFRFVELEFGLSNTVLTACSTHWPDIPLSDSSCSPFVEFWATQ